MKDGEMGFEPVTIARIVRLAQRVEPAKITRCNLGSDNQCASHDRDFTAAGPVPRWVAEDAFGSP